MLDKMYTLGCSCQLAAFFCFSNDTHESSNMAIHVLIQCWFFGLCSLWKRELKSLCYSHEFMFIPILGYPDSHKAFSSSGVVGARNPWASGDGLSPIQSDDSINLIKIRSWLFPSLYGCVAKCMERLLGSDPNEIVILSSHVCLFFIC